ncbi:NucA/NucB deoxyribonuclease domain-containing protein [Streptomyces yangpuensis]
MQPIAGPVRSLVNPQATEHGITLLERTRDLLAALAALTLTAALLALGLSPAAAAPPSAGGAAPKGHGTCTATVPGSKLQRQGAAWSCIRVEPGPAHVPDLVTVRGPANAPTPAQLCADKTTDAPVVSTRHAYCVRMAVNYPLLNSKGQEIGHSLVAIVAMAKFDEKSSAGGKWTEHITALTVEMTPNVEGVTLSFRSMCSGGCTTSGPAWGGAPVILDKDAGGSSTIDYDSHVAKDGIEQIHPVYHVSGETLGAYPINTEGDFYGPDLRCDAAVGGTAGCIVMGHLANVTLRKSQFGAAAVAYEWAQQNLSANNFGTKDKPLLRDAAEKNAENRRAQSCERGPLPFKADLTVYNDSCDEFPFAQSTQGGTNGSLCAEIIPRAIGGGQWRVDLVRGDKNAPCVRAHVDKDQNTGAGGELGRAVQSDRIIDHEWYQVIIIP